MHGALCEQFLGEGQTMMLRPISIFVALFVSLASASAQGQFPPESRLKSIADSQTIRVANRTDATPFAFVSDKGDPVGFSIDLCQLVVKSIAQQLGLQDLKIQWVPVTVQTRFSTITGNRADMECGSSTMTLGRMKEVDFSNIIFAESTGVVVSLASKIQLFAEMTGKKIAVIAGTTNEQAIRDQSDQHHLNIVVVSVKDRDEGIGALESGKVDGYASDKLLLVGTQTKHPEALFMLPDDLSIEAYAITLPRGDWALRLAVNTGLAQIYRSGAIAVVFKRWFDQLGLKPGLLTEAAYALGGLAD
jgi:ABC-type amino acid transport substrate-binding protein